jgi:serine/threonine protein kinase
VTDYLAEPEDETAASALWDARMNAVTVDLYPVPSRVVTQRIRAIPSDEFEALEQASSGWNAYRTAPDVRNKPIGVGSKLRQRYLIESRSGSGGMGTVFKAVDVFRRGQDGVDSHVAIKVLHERTHNHPDVLDKLRREFYCAQALSHRSVIKVYDLDRDDSLDFFTMEWLDGDSLSKVLKQFNPRRLPRPAAWAILREIGEGLVHAHDRKVVHADLKPQNIMITKAGEVRILDFGASSGSGRGQNSSARSKSMAVTPAYASCELLAGHAPDPRDDVFALACLSYELLAGEHPFGYRRATEARDAGMVAKRPPDISSRQWRTLQQGLSWYRKARPISVQVWLQALDVRPGELYTLARLEAAAAESAASPPPITLERRVPTSVLVALAALMLALPVGWLLSHGYLVVHEGAARSESPDAAAISSFPSGAEDLAREAFLPAVATQAAAVAAATTAVRAALPDVTPVAKGVRTHMNPVPLMISTAAGFYRIHPHQRYAEIRVHRSVATQAPSSFEWWTEDGTALAGFDYLGQARSSASFPPGGLDTVLFVKVLANDARREPAKFNVVIANPPNGATLGQSTTRVTLLAMHR